MSVTDTGIPDVPHSPYADTVMERPIAVCAAAADPGRAAAMRAYMKDVAPFLGLTTPVRRVLTRPAGTACPVPAGRTAPRSRCAAGDCPSAGTTASPSISCAVM
ncbi:DNA alkylation repair protein [Streptomyces sp. NPDC093586]|uniref:DNA alkylation repair protein n=1 Tax=Streptomyces sp. NPDC093586 TaxID=3366042 RepID=UPI00381DBC00